MREKVTSSWPCKKKQFLEQDTNRPKHKRKLGIFEYITIKITCKTYYEQKEKTSNRLENTFAVHITNNILVPRIHKELQHFSLGSNSAISSKVEDTHIPKFSNSIVVWSSGERLHMETWKRMFLPHCL